MADVMSPGQRSLCMSRIKGRNTGPEILLRQALWAANLRYRLHSKLPGRPDVVFSRFRMAVFVDGCFWHGCREHGVMPKANGIFWKKKLTGNIERDIRVNQELRKLGWRVLRVWEHEIERDASGVVSKIVETLQSTRRSPAKSSVTVRRRNDPIARRTHR